MQSGRRSSQVAKFDWFYKRNELINIPPPYGPPFRSWKIAGYWLFCDSVIEWPITNQIGYKMMPITNRIGYSWKCSVKWTNLTFPNGPEATKYWWNAWAHPSISLPFESQMALAMAIANSWFHEIASRKGEGSKHCKNQWIIIVDELPPSLHTLPPASKTNRQNPYS